MAWTTPRTWSDGELVTASIMNTHIRDNENMLREYTKVKAADETVNNSSALQNDDDIAITVLANEKWAVHLALNVNSGATPDWKCNWTVPAGTTYKQVLVTPTLGAWANTDITISADGTEQLVMIEAWFLVSSTAGTVQFQWAQATANASNTIVRAGSYMISRRAF